MVDATKTPAEQIDALATRLNRCGQTRIDPERFHIERNDIVISMRRIARELRGEQRRTPTTTWRP